MFCTSCANHASTNLKTFLSWKLTNLPYLLIPSSGETRKIEITDGLVIKWEGACMNRLKSTPTRPGTIRSGKRLRLLTETLTSTLVVKKAIHRSLERGCLRSDNIADRGTVSSSDNKTNNALDLNPPTMSDTKITNNHGGTNSPT